MNEAKLLLSKDVERVFKVANQFDNNCVMICRGLLEELAHKSTQIDVSGGMTV